MTPRSDGFATQLRADLPGPAFRHVLDVFRDETIALATRLSDAANTGDLDAFRRAAHSLAGSAATVGAKALEERARLGMSVAVSQPARIRDLAVEIDQLGREACAQAAELIAALA